MKRALIVFGEAVAIAVALLYWLSFGLGLVSDHGLRIARRKVGPRWQLAGQLDLMISAREHLNFKRFSTLLKIFQPGHRKVQRCFRITFTEQPQDRCIYVRQYGKWIDVLSVLHPG